MLPVAAPWKAGLAAASSYCMCRLLGAAGALFGTSHDIAGVAFALSAPPTIALAVKYTIVPLVIPSVSTTNVFDVAVPADPISLSEVREELVLQNARYVTVAVPIEDPSVYVVTAFQARVSACAAIAVARMASRKTNIMLMAFRLTLSPLG